MFHLPSQKKVIIIENKELNYNNQKIVEDLNNIKSPHTVIGFIVAGLKERYLNGKNPFTVLSRQPAK